MAGSLSMASTAVSLAKVAGIDSGEVGRSAVYSRYNNGPRTLPCDMPTLTEESSVYSVSTFTRKCLLCKLYNLMRMFYCGVPLPEAEPMMGIDLLFSTTGGEAFLRAFQKL
jgi:hypothetical protein